MNRAVVLLVVLLTVRAHAQMTAADTFDPGLIASVYSSALTFMGPRILDPEPVGTLTVWGLRGLTALDPDLMAELHDGKLQLSSAGHVLAVEPVPTADLPNAWAAAAVKLATTAVAVSPAVRRAGTQGIVQSFFDELFNHLDPYSRYVDPREAADDRARRNGEAGIGVTVTQRGSAVVVGAAVSDGPAALAGVAVGDTIVEVNGETLRDVNAATVQSMLAGPEGTTVNLRWRGRDRRLRSAELVRMMVPPETVFASWQGDILTLRVISFNHSTASHIGQALREALTPPHELAGIVLDLRGNRGGLLRQAVGTADLLLPDGVVAATVGRYPDSDEVWRSDAKEVAEGTPLVVLVDGRTASAAEVLAAALADRGRAVVVGSSTLGKGLVQTIEPLPDGGELFITWSRVLAPLGWPIQGLGVLPQVCSSFGEDSLRRQLTALAGGQQPMTANIERERGARAPLSPAQVVAIRNTCPASEGRDTDLIAVRALMENPAIYAAALLPPMHFAQRP